MIEKANIKSISVLIMEVPCCSELVKIAQQAVVFSSRRISVSGVIVSTAKKNIKKT